VVGCGGDEPIHAVEHVASALVTSASDEVPRPLMANNLEESGDRWVESVGLDDVGDVWSVDGGSMLVETLSGVWSLSAELGVGQTTIAGFPGRVHAVASVDAETVLVASGEGLHAVGGQEAVVSPVEEALGGARVRALSVAGGAVWMTSDLGLHRWVEGQVQTVVVPGFDAADAKLVHGPLLGGIPALWIASEGRIAALVESGTGLQTQLVREGHPVETLAADGSGNVWTLAGGRVHQRDPDGIWRLLKLDDSVEALASHPNAAGVWMRLDNGVVVHGSKGVFRIVTDLPDGALAAVDDEGNAWILGDLLHRVVPGRPATLTGLAEGGVIYGESALVLDVAFAAQVASVAAVVGVHALEVEDLGEQWQIALDPASLGEGAHVLDVTVVFADDAPDSHASLAFVVAAPPTWSQDIQPIYQASCSPCHSSSYSSHPLDSPEQWVEEIDSILWMVSHGLMPEKPYAPLTEWQVSLIEAWADAEFPE